MGNKRRLITFLAVFGLALAAGLLSIGIPGSAMFSRYELGSPSRAAQLSCLAPGLADTSWGVQGVAEIKFKTLLSKSGIAKHLVFKTPTTTSTLELDGIRRTFLAGEVFDGRRKRRGVYLLRLNEGLDALDGGFRPPGSAAPGLAIWWMKGIASASQKAIVVDSVLPTKTARSASTFLVSGQINDNRRQGHGKVGAGFVLNTLSGRIRKFRGRYAAVLPIDSEDRVVTIKLTTSSEHSKAELETQVELKVLGEFTRLKEKIRSYRSGIRGEFRYRSIAYRDGNVLLYGATKDPQSTGVRGVCQSYEYSQSDSKDVGTAASVRYLESLDSRVVGASTLTVDDRSLPVLFSVQEQGRSIEMYDYTSGRRLFAVDPPMKRSGQRLIGTSIAGDESLHRLTALWRESTTQSLIITKTCLSASATLPPGAQGNGPSGPHNSQAPCDVNGDGFVSNLDLDLLVNKLNTEGASGVLGEPYPPYYDVDDDGILSVGDYLRELRCGFGALETPTPTTTAVDTAPAGGATPTAVVTSIPTVSGDKTPTPPSVVTPINTAISTRTAESSPTSTAATTPTQQPTAITSPPGGELLGLIEGITHNRDGSVAYGWACRSVSDLPTEVTIRVGSETLGRGIANAKVAGLSSCGGRTAHGFAVPLTVPSTLTLSGRLLSGVVSDPWGTRDLAVAPVARLSAGDIMPLFGNSYPKALFFRSGIEGVYTGTGDVQVRWAPDIERNRPAWIADLSKLGGVFAKTQAEEYSNYAEVESTRNLKSISAEPKQLTLIHFNGIGWNPFWKERQRFSAQDWLYLPGCDSLGRIGATDSVIELPQSCLDRFKKCVRGPKSNEPEAPACIPENLVAVKRDASGALDWSVTEYLKVVDLGSSASGTRITVSRSEFGSTRQSFPARAYIAPFSYNGPWPTRSNQINWNVNLARASARHNFVAALRDNLQSAQAADAIDGVTLDISFWEAMKNEGRLADYDTNGIADGGFEGAVNIYGQGVLQFHRELKEALGPSKIVLADGSEVGTRDLHVINGSENEGFSGPSDGDITEWSTGLNHLNFNANRTSRPHLKYVVTKNLTSIGGLRLSMAATTILGGAIANFNQPYEFLDRCTPAEEEAASFNKNGIPIADEIFGGVGGQMGWLGAPLEGVQRPILSSPKRHPAGVVDLRELATPLGDVTVQHLADRSVVAPSSGGTRNFSIQLSGDTAARRLKALATSDYALILDVRAEGALDGFESEAVVPRKISVTSNEQLPSPTSTPRPLSLTKQARELASPFGQDWTRLVFFYRNSFVNDDLRFTVRFEGSRPVSIRNVKLVHGQDTLLRRFENGVVIANPSLRPASLDLSARYPRLYPGVPFRRLQASRCQDGAFNDGREEGATVAVPSADALFLQNNRVGMTK